MAFGFFKKAWKATRVERLKEQIADLERRLIGMTSAEHRAFETYVSEQMPFIGSNIKDAASVSAHEIDKMVAEEQKYARLSLRNMPEAVVHGLSATALEAAFLVRSGIDGAEGILNRSLSILDAAHRRAKN